MRKRGITLADLPMPTSTEEEYQVIGDFIGTPEERSNIMKIVSPLMFSDDSCRRLWLILADKHTHNENIDLVSIYSLCDKAFLADNIIPRCSYSGMVSSMSHAKALQEAFTKREIYKAGVKMINGAVSGEASAELLEIPKSMEKTIEANTSISDMASLSDSLREVSEELGAESRMIRCGVPTIDNFCNGGFGAGHFIVIGGRPGEGKTSLSLDFAMTAARNGYKACFFTIEMTNKELAKKIMVATGEVTMFDLARQEKDWDRIERALQAADTKGLYISKKCSSITQIANKITTMHQDGKCDIAFVDYIQIVQGVGGELRERITYITNTLKALARDLEIPIVAMSQLSRGSKSEKRNPMLTDLKESGSIEQDADVVILLDVKDEDKGKNRIDAYLAKNRHGLSSYAPIRLQGTKGFANFYELIDDYEESGING